MREGVSGNINNFSESSVNHMGDASRGVGSGTKTTDPRLKRCKSLTWDACTWKSDFIPSVLGQQSSEISDTVENNGNAVNVEDDFTSSVIDFLVSGSVPKSGINGENNGIEEKLDSLEDFENLSMNEKRKTLTRRATFCNFPKELSGDVIRGGKDHLKLRAEAGAYEYPPEWHGLHNNNNNPPHSIDNNENEGGSLSSSSSKGNSNNGGFMHDENKPPNQQLLQQQYHKMQTLYQSENDENNSNSNNIEDVENNKKMKRKPLLKRVNSAELVRRAFPTMLFDRVSPSAEVQNDLSMLENIAEEVDDDQSSNDDYNDENNGDYYQHEIKESNEEKVKQTVLGGRSSSSPLLQQQQPPTTHNEYNGFGHLSTNNNNVHSSVNDGSFPPLQGAPPPQHASAQQQQQQMYSDFQHTMHSQFMYYMQMMYAQQQQALGHGGQQQQQGVAPPGMVPSNNMQQQQAFRGAGNTSGNNNNNGMNGGGGGGGSGGFSGYQETLMSGIQSTSAQRNLNQNGIRGNNGNNNKTNNVAPHLHEGSVWGRAPHITPSNDTIPQYHGNDTHSNGSISPQMNPGGMNSAYSANGLNKQQQQNMMDGNSANNQQNGHMLPVCSTLLAEHKHAGKKPNIHELMGHVLEFSKDSHGSRYLQEVMAASSPPEKEMLINEIIEDCLIVMQDLFGNYVMQNFLDHATNEQRDIIANKMRGVLVNLSMHPHGCRVVQRALDVINPEIRCELLKELVFHPGNLEMTAKDAHATHVLQKAVVVLQRDVYPHLSNQIGRGDQYKRKKEKPSRQVMRSSVDPVIIETNRKLLKAVEDIVAANVMVLAVNQHACRLVQRVLGDCDRNRSPCVSIMMDALESDYANLSIDQHGNFIMQHILEFGQDDQADRIQDYVGERVVELSQHKFGSHLVEKSLMTASEDRACKIIKDLLHVPCNVLTKMMKDPYANFVLQRAYDVAPLPLKNEIDKQVSERAEVLSQFTHGRHILAHLAKRKGQQQL